jgi:hypothetical protein
MVWLRWVSLSRRWICHVYHLGRWNGLQDSFSWSFSGTKNVLDFPRGSSSDKATPTFRYFRNYAADAKVLTFFMKEMTQPFRTTISSDRGNGAIWLPIALRDDIGESAVSLYDHETHLVSLVKGLELSIAFWRYENEVSAREENACVRGTFNFDVSISNALIWRRFGEMILLQDATNGISNLDILILT